MVNTKYRKISKKKRSRINMENELNGQTNKIFVLMLLMYTVCIIFI